MTFNVLSAGNDILASALNENFRHVNFGSPLNPVDALGNPSDGNLDFGSSSAHWANAYFGDGTNIALRVDASNRNVAIGRNSLSSWSSGFSALQIGGLFSILSNESIASSSGVNMSQNAYYDGSWKYILADEASSISMQNGVMKLQRAVTGTIDGAITWLDSLYLDSSGNMGVGGSAPSYLGDFSKSNSGATNTLSIRNTNTTAASDARILAEVAATGDSDPFIELSIAGGQSWYAGIDNSDSDNFKISENSDLSSESLEIEASTGVVNFPLGVKTERCQVKLSSDEIFVGSSYNIQWDTEVFDTNTMHDNTTNPERITVNNQSVYAFSVNIDISGGTDDHTEYVVAQILRKNSSGTTQNRWETRQPELSNMGITISGIDYCDANDYFQVNLNNQTSATLSVGFTQSHFSVFKLL